MAARASAKKGRRKPGPIPKREKARYPIEDRIRDSAERVFAEAGLRGATLAAIAKGADLSLPTVIRHVDGIEKLYREVVARVIARLRDRTPEPVEGDPAAWFLAAAETLVEKPHRARLLMRELLDGGKVLAAELAPELEALASSVRSMTAGGEAEPADDDPQPAAILALLTHAALGPIATAYAAPEPLRLNLRRLHNRAVLIETLQRLLRGGLPAATEAPATPAPTPGEPARRSEGGTTPERHRGA